MLSQRIYLRNKAIFFHSTLERYWNAIEDISLALKTFCDYIPIMTNEFDKLMMSRALELAHDSFKEGEVPVGAVVTLNGNIIGEGRNQVIAKKSILAHAELEAISSASINISNFRLVDCEIYCTLEPCYMCAMAIVHARIKKIFFATKEPKAGCIISNDHLFNKNFLNHKVIYDYGIYKDKSSLLLKNFFKSLRNK
tara:strand:- start:2126 stop:2713 length:588 start_codon:yes stop_codon:yes gene_type:complete